MNYLLNTVAVCLVAISVSGCGKYDAVEEVGYDAPWYVTVIYEDGSRKSKMVEEIARLAKEETSPKPVKVEGVDRRSQKKVLIDIESVLKMNPDSTLVVDKYRAPIAGTFTDLKE